jgi:two-component system chemotaxis response regulator CheB
MSIPNAPFGDKAGSPTQADSSPSEDLENVFASLKYLFDGAEPQGSPAVPAPQRPEAPADARPVRIRDVFVIGASAGGIRAVIEVLSRMPVDLPATIGVVIHRGASTSADWSGVLGSKTALRVVEPADGDPLVQGVVYVAPADRHMTFIVGRVHLDHGAKRHHTRPAVDPLFTSAALAYGRRVVGVVLTGGGHDGLQGLLDVKAAGGISLAQKPEEAAQASMPVHAITCDHVDAVLSVDEIGDALGQLARGAAVRVHDWLDHVASA